MNGLNGLSSANIGRLPIIKQIKKINKAFKTAADLDIDFIYFRYPRCDSMYQNFKKKLKDSGPNSNSIAKSPLSLTIRKYAKVFQVS